MRNALTPGRRAPRRSGAHPAGERLRRGLTRNPGKTDEDRTSCHRDAASAPRGPDTDGLGNRRRDGPGARRAADGRGESAHRDRTTTEGAEHPGAPGCADAEGDAITAPALTGAGTTRTT